MDKQNPQTIVKISQKLHKQKLSKKPTMPDCGDDNDVTPEPYDIFLKIDEMDEQLDKASMIVNIWNQAKTNKDKSQQKLPKVPLNSLKNSD